jgi:HSP20 family protein
MNLLKKWRNSDRSDGNRTTALTKHDGGSDWFSRMRGEIDQAFDRFWTGDLASLPAFNAWPAVDMSEDEDKLTLRVDVPGLDEKDVDIEISGNLLTIRGSREQEHTDSKHRRRERLSGSFARTVTLPSYVDMAKVEARYDKGVLTLTAPKMPGKGPRRVKVSA